MAKEKASPRPASKISVNEKEFRPGVTREVVGLRPKEYLQIVALQHEIQITRWCFGVMAVCTAAFLATWFLWGFNVMPNLTKDAVVWFGKATVGIIGGAFATIIAAKFRKRG